MRWKHVEQPKPDKKFSLRFALWPTQINDTWIWLEFYWTRDVWYKNAFGTWSTAPAFYYLEDPRP